MHYEYPVCQPDLEVVINSTWGTDLDLPYSLITYWENNLLHTYKHTQGVKSNPHLLLPQQPPVKMTSSCPRQFLQKKQMNHWRREKREKEKKGDKQMKHSQGCQVGSLSASSNFKTTRQAAKGHKLLENTYDEKATVKTSVTIVQFENLVVVYTRQWRRVTNKFT